MAIDSTREARRAVLTIMKADATLIAIVAKDSIYPQRTDPTPAWPFIRCGSPSVVPVRASCVDGGNLTMAVHAFAKPRMEGQSVTETAEDHTSRIGAAIARALDGQKVNIAGGTLTIAWQGSQLLQDPEEADAFHTVQNFRIRCITG
jgi:hypothetical protein